MEVNGKFHDPAALPPKKKLSVTTQQEVEWVCDSESML
jgi:hypothetical protein